MEKIWLLHILWYPIHESSEKLTFDQKTMYDCVISNLNSEQLVLGQIENLKLLYSLVMKQKSLGAFNIFVLRKKIGFLTFYGGKYINLVKY